MPELIATAWTNLVVYLLVRQRELHELLKVISLALELDSLRPIVEGSCHIDFTCGMFPICDSSGSATFDVL
jgi:hypothetical protein